MEVPDSSAGVRAGSAAASPSTLLPRKAEALAQLPRRDLLAVAGGALGELRCRRQAAGHDGLEARVAHQDGGGLQGGRIVADGTHDGLLESSAAYREVLARAAVEDEQRAREDDEVASEVVT